MRLKYWLFLFFTIATAVRLIFNFSQELIPGVNGGYYPLQVRTILTNGHMGFADMPFLFYLDALLVKWVSFFGFPITDTLILNVVKVVDSVSLPLLLLPLYKIVQLSNISQFLKISLLAFSVLSFSPLVLTSDLQKNALAIVWLFATFAYYISYQINKKKIEIALSAIFLVLTGLTHFGTFIFELIFLLLIVLYTYKKRALIPVFFIVVVSLGIVFIIDSSRFTRLFSVGNTIFKKPALFTNALALPDVFIILLSLLFIILGILVYKKYRNHLALTQKAVIMASIICLFIGAFPLLNGEYFKRLSLFLFIPQIVLVVQIATVMSSKHQHKLGVIIMFFTFLSILAVAGHPKETVINQNAYADLKKMQSVIVNRNETLVIARHGLEWWTAWALKTKVGQDKSIDHALFEKYKTVIVLNQISGFSKDAKRNPFHEPYAPKDAEILYSTAYFIAYKLR